MKYTETKKKKLKLVIFDLDGVVVSTDELHYLAWKKIADKEGIPFSRKINARQRGVSRKESLEVLLEQAEKHYFEERKQELMEEKNQIYVAFLQSLSDLDIMPGVTAVLNALDSMGIKTAIGSSSKNAKLILEKIGLLDRFSFISDGTMIQKSKPFPDVFLNASKALNIDSEECWVVEDAKAGIEAAKAAQMTAVALGDAYGYCLADYSLENMEELIDIIKEYNAYFGKENV